MTIDCKQFISLLRLRISSDVRDKKLSAALAEYLLRIAEEIAGEAKLWKNPAKELPENINFVLAIITGRANGIQCDHAPAIASYDPDDGWMLEDVPDKAGDTWTVDKWMYITEE